MNIRILVRQIIGQAAAGSYARAAATVLTAAVRIRSKAGCESSADGAQETMSRGERASEPMTLQTPAETLPHAAAAAAAAHRAIRPRSACRPADRQRSRQSARDFPTLVARRTSSSYTGVYSLHVSPRYQPDPTTTFRRVAALLTTTGRIAAAV